MDKDIKLTSSERKIAKACKMLDKAIDRPTLSNAYCSLRKSITKEFANVK